MKYLAIVTLAATSAAVFAMPDRARDSIRTEQSYVSDASDLFADSDIALEQNPRQWSDEELARLKVLALLIQGTKQTLRSKLGIELGRPFLQFAHDTVYEPAIDSSPTRVRSAEEIQMAQRRHEIISEMRAYADSPAFQDAMNRLIETNKNDGTLQQFVNTRGALFFVSLIDHQGMDVVFNIPILNQDEPAMVGLQWVVSF